MAFDQAILYAGSSASNINLKNTGATLLFNQINQTKSFNPLYAVLLAGSITGVLTSGPTLSIGTNASNYNNIFSGTITQFVTGDSGLLIPLAITKTIRIPASTDVFVNVTVGANTTGNYTARIGLLGFFN